MSWTHRQFFTGFLEQLGLPVNTPSLRALAAVSLYESSQGNERWFNPLACTQDWPDATNYNSANVKRYRTFADGIEASAKLFAQPHWANVRKAFANSGKTTRTPILNEFKKAYTWVSNPYFSFTIEQCDARLNQTIR